MTDKVTPKPRGEIVIYEPAEGEARVEVRLEGETVWLSLNQMANLFQRDKSVVSRHLRNVFASGELREEATVAKFATVQTEGGREVVREIEHFNLDAILSVGYRVNSRRGTDFRIWATNTLRDHIIKGYTINQRRLSEQTERYQELQEAVGLIGEVLRQKELDGPQAEGLLHVITDYAYALSLLDDYDHQRLAIRNTTRKEPFEISYESARAAIDAMADRMRQDGKEVSLFGHEKDDSFKGSLSAIYQTFDGDDLYPSIEEKAAHLLYFIVKNHSFTDGNKRIAASVFLWFLDGNGLLYSGDGRKRIGDNALVALTLMIAESRAQHKDIVVKVIVNLINRDN
jgi:prophage maintenance system killer protein